MVKSIIIIVLFLFAISGICDFLFFLRKIIFTPKSKIKCYSVVFLTKDFALDELKYFWEKMRWYGGDFATMVIAFGDHLKAEEFEKCKKFCTGKSIILTTLEESIKEWKTPDLKNMSK